MRRICRLILFASVLLILTAQSPFAEKKGTNRPLKGSLVGAATFVFPPAAPGCPDGYAKVTTLALGNLSHLGLTEAHFTHCSNQTGTDYQNAVLILTAANGDELRATYTYNATTADHHILFVVYFDKGTGRFENASGTANLDAQVQKPADLTEPWPWRATLEGSISY